MLLYAVLANTIFFGLMAVTSHKTNPLIPAPGLRNKQTMIVFLVIDAVINIGYILTFPWIIFSSNNYLLNIGIALLMQFVVNHFVWGILLSPIAIVDGIRIRRKLNRQIAEAVENAQVKKKESDGLAQALGDLKQPE